MTIADISLLFDAALAVLLAVMIFYSVRLNKRIVMLRDGEADLQRMISQFNDTSVVVQDSARKLRSAGTEAEFGVKAAVAKGMALRNELDVMLEQAELLVDKLNDNPGRFENSSPTRPAPTRPVPSRPVPSRSAPSGAAPTRPPSESVVPERVAPGAAWGPTSSVPIGEKTNISPFAPPVRSADEVVRAEAFRDDEQSTNLLPRTEAERHLLDAIRAAKEGVA